MKRQAIAPGEVWLVGAGPGDPELLTLKAARLIAAADAIFYDALVGPDVLNLASPGAKLVHVGKRAGAHAMHQERINALLVEAARSGMRVVRLKGGDPSIFGRSREELDALAEAGVPARICPGVTAASAAAASAGASLTLRGTARKLVFVTAQSRGGDATEPDWHDLARSGATLAIYMGRSAASGLAQKLIAGGRDAATPVLVAIDVSLPSERLVHGTLASLGFLIRTLSGEAPTLLIVGEAAASARAARSLVREAIPISPADAR